LSDTVNADVVSKELCEFLQDALRQPVQAGDDIFATGLANSMFALELIVYIESRYDLTLQSDDLTRDNFSSSDAMTRLILKRAAAVEGSWPTCSRTTTT
jgi:acyl carrier protein